MTDDRNFDRIARAWLELAPNEAPDRAVSAVLQTVATTPQVRPLSQRLPRRITTMNRLPMVAAAAAVIVLVLGGGVWLLQKPSSGVAAAPPTAAATSPSTSIDTTIPAALQFTWIGPPRSIPNLPAVYRFRFNLGPNSLGFPNDDQNNAYLRSDAVAPAPGQLQVTSLTTGFGCVAGDTGHYRWSLSPGGTRLTVHIDHDACAARAQALSGDWIRVNCINADGGCFGDLEAGTYPSQYVAPRLGPSDPWTPSWGSISYTVPAGWANSADWPHTLTLTPASNYALETKDGPPDGQFHELDVLVDPHGNLPTPGCGRSIDANAPATVDGLLGWLATQPSLSTTKPTAVTVDGHPGKWVDVQLAPTWTQSCTGGPSEPVSTFLAYPVDGADPWTISVAGRERIRLILVDLDGRTIAVLIDSSDPTSFNALVAQSMPIVASLHFE